MKKREEIPQRLSSRFLFAVFHSDTVVHISERFAAQKISDPVERINDTAGYFRKPVLRSVRHPAF